MEREREGGGGGGWTEGWMDAGIRRQSGSDCGGACFHGNLPAKGVGMGEMLGRVGPGGGGGGLYVYVCMYHGGPVGLKKI